MYSEQDDTPDAEAPEQPAVPVEQMLAQILQADNIADMLPDDELDRIGELVKHEHEIDLESQSEWREKMKKGIALAKLAKEDRTYPWPGAANVKYPLVLTAALQFNARAYPAVCPATDVVKVKTYGIDPDGRKSARGERVSRHMSWQLLTQMPEWEKTTDDLLTQLPIVGTMVRKIWFDPLEGRPRVRLLEPDAFVINDKAKTIEEAPRVGEILSLFPSEIETRKRSGYYRDVDLVEADGDDKDAVQVFIEQHRRLDLDGDGYEEPYIVTVHEKSGKVARVVADFDADDVTFGGPDGQTWDEMGNMVPGPREVVRIRRNSYFVPYHFMPNVEGGFMGMGLGLLLGDISETINSICNLMLDAGHMASRGGGFIGSDFRLKGGSNQFRPGEWKMVPTQGRDIRQAMVPLTLPGPDATLFQMLGLLIDAGEKVASVSDVMTGEAGQRNMTATTTLALIEQGMAVFSAVYKRIFRSLKQEYKFLARMNADNVSPEEYQMFQDEPADPQQDYAAGDYDIEPVADPNSTTKPQIMARAQVYRELAMDGLIDPAAAVEEILDAINAPDKDALLPKPNAQQEMMAQMQMQAAQAELTLQHVKIETELAEIKKTEAETIKLLAEVESSEQAQLLDARRLQLEQTKLRLQGLKDAIGTTLGRSAGGMARPSGDAAGDQGAGPGAGRAQEGLLRGMLAGAAVAGSGTGGQPFPG